MSKKFSTISCFIAIFALAMMAFAPAAFAHHADDHTQGSGSTKDPENTPGNDRKEGYEDNSKTPQETNHGKGSDKDGDAGNDSRAYTEDDDSDGRNNAGHTSDGSSTTYPNASRHPSGKDRYIEGGRSGNQGRSESNPDDSKGPMRYEGTQGDDKPNGPGGSDVFDQDGNNGCGNDQDFDDDNNGWCGRPTKPATVSDNRTKPCDADATMPGIQACDKPDEVLGEVITAPCDKDNNMANGIQACDKPKEILPDLESQPTLPEEEVLGERIERAENPARPEGPSVLGVRLSPALAQPVAVAGAVLPFTGGEALVFLIAAFALILAGAAAMMFRRSEA